MGKSSRAVGLVTVLVAFSFAALVGALGGFLLTSRFGEVAQDSVHVSTLPAQNEPQTTTLQNRDVQDLIMIDTRVVEENDRFQLQGIVTSPEVGYRLATLEPWDVRAVINGGPGGFECAWRGVISSDLPMSSGEQTTSTERPDPSSVGVTVACDIPADIHVAPGLTATIAISVDKPEQVPTLPRTAVFGSQDSGYVIVVRADGSQERRNIGLGQSDSIYVEVTNGLEADEHVLTVPLATDLVDAP